MENNQKAPNYLADQQEDDYAKPEWVRDTRGDLVMNLPGYTSMSFGVRAGSKIISTSTSDQSNNSTTSASSLSSGTITSTVAVGTGDVHGNTNGVTIDGEKSRITIGEYPATLGYSWIMDKNHIGGYQNTGLIFGMILQDGQYRLGTSTGLTNMKKGEFLFGNYPTAYVRFIPATTSVDSHLIVHATLDGADGNFSGTITATAGNIGGWKINSSSLSSNTTESSSSILLDSNNSLIRVGSTSSNYIIIDGSNNRIQSSNYVSGNLGNGFLISSDLIEANNIVARGMIRTSVFQKDTVSAIGGSFAVLDGDILETDMTSLDNSTLHIKGTTTFAVGDILRIKDGTDDEWLEVTNIDNAPIYVVDRDMSGNYSSNNNPAWTKGASVINYKQSGNGGVYMTASETNAPYLSIFDHTGTPWSTINTRLRIGNLNGFLGYTSNLYGIAVGDSTNYLKYDATNGLRISGNITLLNLGDIDQTQLMNAAQAGADVTLSAINSGLSVTGGGIILSGGGAIKGGQTAYNTGTGFFLGYDTDNYKFSIGNSSSDYITWNGSSLNISGNISATSGTIGGFTIASNKIYATSGNGIIASDNDSYPLAKMSNNGITLKITTGSQGLTMINSSGTQIGYSAYWGNFTTNNSWGFSSVNDLVLTPGNTSGSCIRHSYGNFHPNLGNSSYPWGGLYIYCDPNDATTYTININTGVTNGHTHTVSIQFYGRYLTINGEKRFWFSVS